MRRTLRVIVISLAALFAALAAAVLVIFNSPQAFRYLAARFAPAGLAVKNISGTLAGPLEMKGIDYSKGTKHISIGDLRMDWRPAELLALRVHITRITIDRMQVVIKKTVTVRPRPPVRLPQFRLPPFISLSMDKVTAKDVRYMRAGKTKAIVLDRLAFGAAMSGGTLVIRYMKAATPEAALGTSVASGASVAFRASGTIMTLDDYPLSLKTRWSFATKKYPRAEGSGSISGSLDGIRLRQKIKPPYNADVDFTVSNILRRKGGPLAWSGSVSWRRLRLRLPSPPQKQKSRQEKILASRRGEFSTKGSENTYRLRLTADISLTKTPPFSIDVKGKGGMKALVLESFTVHVLNGQLQGSGRLSWRKQKTKGTRLRFAFRTAGKGLNAALLFPKWKGGRVGFAATVSGAVSKARRDITIESFTAHALDGQLGGTGRLSLEKTKKTKSSTLRFALKIAAKGLNTALLSPKWKGRVGFNAGISGAVSKPRRDIALDIMSIGGRLRGYPLSGRGRISIRDKDYFIPFFVLRSGTARIFASGSRINRRWNLSWDLNAKNLRELLPEAGGRLSARGTLTGRGKKPIVTAAIAGTGTKYKKYLVKHFRGTLRLDLSDRERSDIDLTAAGLEAGRMKVRLIRLEAAGRLPRHRIDLSAEGQRTAAALSLEGGWSRGVWKGVMTGFRLSEHQYGTWALVRPSPLLISKAETAAAFCLANGKARICLEAHIKKAVRTHVTLAASGVPLGLLHPLLPPGLVVTGTMNGNANVLYVKRQLAGSADIRLVNGAFFYSLRGKKMRFSFRESVLAMRSANRTVTIDWRMPFVEGGGIESRLIIHNLSTINGNIRMEIPNLAIVSAMVPNVKDVRGVLKAGLNVSGPLKNPGLSGQLAVEKASASLPTLGIKLTGINLTVKSAGKNTFLIDGVVHSGKGALAIRGGSARTPAKIWSATLNIKGKNFLALETPMAHVEASPDLNVSLLDRKATLAGRVDIPLADIKIKKVPSEAARPSRDVVITGRKKVPVKAMKLQITTNVTVVLGKRINFNGFGVKSSITGSLTVSEAPGKIATGRGELVIVKGKYKAYGQNLAIRQGRLLFSGGPVDDPGLDIQAIRKAQNGVIAGIHVTGTLKAPKLTIFSEPPMDETDALAYLVLGKPLHSATSSQGSLLYNAATTAGLAGGQFVAARIGALFGITKVSVEKGPLSATGQQEATLFLGRYLSPRLYVAYGVGLFETSNVFRVRYRLTRDWLVQSETGTETGGDVFWKLEW